MYQARKSNDMFTKIEYDLTINCLWSLMQNLQLNDLSDLQELWDDISEQESLYKKLWRFGVRLLQSRECSLYETADILLGDHLSEKS